MSGAGSHNFNYILVVDDDQDDQFFLRRTIGDAIPGAIVESLYDGSEVMAYLGSSNSLPDLIFLDLNMVKLSGRDTLRLIRNKESLKQVPVIILTTSRNSDERQEMLNLGASEFYSKPAHYSGLGLIVEEVKAKWLVHA